ncbi:2-C-methyl-D-erythritol 4-phosphate cytidylyltransferase [Sulfoacidibacillus thermotolerans]|nr:2-C-methyl-D-erythritol 4-phosphate cytidylyltransferase [Sulfoacidibacillus thermotolerans]
MGTQFDKNVMEEVAVLVMAAGTGTRMGATERKQWLMLCGRPLFIFTVERLLSFGITSCLVVVHPTDLQRARIALDERGLYAVPITAGGVDRQASVWEGLQFAKTRYVAVHDGARPFLTQADFSAVLKEAIATGAATLAHPVIDTLKRSDGSTKVAQHIDREGLWAVQTPQVFLREWLYEAHVAAQVDNFHGTDDTVLLARIGKSVSLVRGSKWNIKLTDQDDLAYMRLWEAVSCGSD